MPNDKSYLILGGGGMIGYQVALHICYELQPEKIIIASLRQDEVQEAIVSLKRNLKQKATGVTFVPFWGNVFVRKDFTNEERLRLMESSPRRNLLFDDIYGDIEIALVQSQLAALILEHKPNVIVDAMNTATAISYQDIASASFQVKEVSQYIKNTIPEHIDNINKILKQLKETSSDAESESYISHEDITNTLNDIQKFFEIFKTHEGRDRKASTQELIETLLISQSIPQLVRHVLLIYEAMKRAQTRLYVKVGTTGTGGMGFNIPYTHSEAKPSSQLMSKTAIAFAHTGLLFLMARTPDAPLVKEIKPAAMVGYRKIAVQTVKKRDGSPRFVFASQELALSESLQLRLPENGFNKKGKMKMAGVDTGENGFFAVGEFEAITNMKQMEFTTPEEIAETVLLEIIGRNTGLDVISGLDASVMNPSYRAGYLRQSAIERAHNLERRIGGHSVALRDLGPPELSKLLYEAHLLALEYKKLDEVLKHSANKISLSLEKRLNEEVGLRDQITSIGIPILKHDGKSIWRGPIIAYPEIAGNNNVMISPKDIDQYAKKGWVDLRPQNIEIWSKRIEHILRERRKQLDQPDEGSATFRKDFYYWDEIRIGEIVGWIFNNEMGGYRILGL